MTRLTWVQMPEQHLGPLPRVGPVPEQSFLVVLLLSAKRWSLGLAGRGARVLEEDREQRSRARCPNPFRQPSVLPQLKTPTSGHHDVDCRPRMGDAGSDDSGSLLDLFDVTVCVTGLGVRRCRTRPNAPVSAGPKETLTTTGESAVDRARAGATSAIPPTVKRRRFALHR